jgi:2'-5' RNA ligase
MLRLFTGLEIPDSVATQLSFLRGGLPGARWIDPENYHITLRFIGDVDHRVADTVYEALSRINRKAFTLKLQGLASFGGKKPHSVYAKVEPCQELLELQSEQERLMQRIGLAPESRKYTPHITLARCKRSTLKDVADWLSMRGGFQAPDLTVNHFVLFSSKASVGGGPYLREEIYSLNSTFDQGFMV